MYGFGFSKDHHKGIASSRAHASSYSGNYEVNCKGGLNPNGSLNLDRETVERLYDRFVQNIWTRYPIFDGHEFKQHVMEFCERYSPSTRLSNPKCPVDFTLLNATILLVLALRKLCECGVHATEA